MQFTIERNRIDVLGTIWMPSVQAATQINLSRSDVANILSRDGDTLREKCEDWLGTHTGDFQSVDDFHAIIGSEEVHWSNEENEFTFSDCMYPSEE